MRQRRRRSETIGRWGAAAHEKEEPPSCRAGERRDREGRAAAHGKIDQCSDTMLEFDEKHSRPNHKVRSFINNLHWHLISY